MERAARLWQIWARKAGVSKRAKPLARLPPPNPLFLPDMPLPVGRGHRS
jgi:hypothetical protein